MHRQTTVNPCRQKGMKTEVYQNGGGPPVAGRLAAAHAGLALNHLHFACVECTPVAERLAAVSGASTSQTPFKSQNKKYTFPQLATIRLNIIFF